MSHTIFHSTIFQNIFEREQLRRRLQEIYLAKLLRFVPPIVVPPLPGPDPAPFSDALNFQSSITSEIANQNILIGELLAHALGDPDPQPNNRSIINEMKKDGLHLEVIEGLIQQIEIGTESLKSELATLKKCN